MAVEVVAPNETQVSEIFQMTVVNKEMQQNCHTSMTNVAFHLWFCDRGKLDAGWENRLFLHE